MTCLIHTKTILIFKLKVVLLSENRDHDNFTYLVTVDTVLGASRVTTAKFCIYQKMDLG